jgi:hypothetical protein
MPKASTNTVWAMLALSVGDSREDLSTASDKKEARAEGQEGGADGRVTEEMREYRRAVNAMGSGGWRCRTRCTCSCWEAAKTGEKRDCPPLLHCFTKPSLMSTRGVTAAAILTTLSEP